MWGKDGTFKHAKVLVEGCKVFCDDVRMANREDAALVCPRVQAEMK